MTEHLPSHTIELLTSHRLAPEELLKATRHLATCAQCREKASEAADINKRLPDLRTDQPSTPAETAHLDYEQLEAYVDDSLTVKDREAVKLHLFSCPACAEETRELELLRDNLETYPAATRDLVPARAPSASSWAGLAAFLQWRPTQLAFLAAALLLIAVVALFFLRRPAPPPLVNNPPSRNGNLSNQNSEVVGANTNAVNDNQEAPDRGSETAGVSPYEKIVKEAIETQKLTPPAALRDLAGKESKLLGPAENRERFGLLSPVATLVRGNLPTFRWQQLSGASSYEVAILDLNLNVIEKSGPIAGFSWAPHHQLKRNVIYIWQVTALKDGREVTAPAAPAREARFKILSAERLTALSRASTEMAGSHLKLGIVEAHEGLLDEAEREFRAAIAANEDAAAARKLLQSVRQMRR